jgi:hypothetical protein
VGAGIEISRLGGAGSNNVAECLAVLAACEAAKESGIQSPEIRTDSQLVVCWCNGSYRILSDTARRYVPQIRAALAEINGKLRWTPGRSNPADRYSRALFGGAPVVKTDDPLEYVRLAPMAALRFRDFAKLKAGRDAFSNLRLSELRRRVPEHDQVLHLPENYQAVALRWVLRGLTIDKAIRKVETEREIGRNFRGMSERG